MPAQHVAIRIGEWSVVQAPLWPGHCGDMIGLTGARATRSGIEICWRKADPADGWYLGKARAAQFCERWTVGSPSRPILPRPDAAPTATEFPHRDPVAEPAPKTTVSTPGAVVHAVRTRPAVCDAFIRASTPTGPLDFHSLWPVVTDVPKHLALPDGLIPGLQPVDLDIFNDGRGARIYQTIQSPGPGFTQQLWVVDANDDPVRVLSSRPLVKTTVVTDTDGTTRRMLTISVLGPHEEPLAETLGNTEDRELTSSEKDRIARYPRIHGLFLDQGLIPTDEDASRLAMYEARIVSFPPLSSPAFRFWPWHTAYWGYTGEIRVLRIQDRVYLRWSAFGTTTPQAGYRVVLAELERNGEPEIVCDTRLVGDPLLR
jgi:hypothetical protein